ncbi:MAG: DNA-binding protein [Lachnospiraceae bacterium]|jgi:predicted DNA-binding protein YlxM (UPF0122 family)|nr:DNA-binding protein [Lachnospiraceae bacterium]
MEQERKDEGLEERVELSLLYDFYGALLKENQQRMFEASILEDYNFTEIAEEEGISRQGVYDAIKRATKQLRAYEEKLGLVAKFERQKKLVKLLKGDLQQLKVSEGGEHLGRVLDILDEILEE